MKKFLLGCAAASVLLIGIAVVHMQTPTEKNTPSSLPNKPTEDVKTYSEAEIQILEAAESYLYYKNLLYFQLPLLQSFQDICVHVHLLFP